ncbi:NAD(P)H-dependent oxidoreductase [Streptomyces sp. V4-01]|uniref:FMN dependent NADH:quinone oxidoreductase n=1 Tax=Actinacidiphila polyblastidii TaxID=3110430 RepID=A0ABU7P3V6_9ACTN|nr:NAD(P)H-dependent oxidoreductase [Streptomyces sp. V4-01]
MASLLHLDSAANRSGESVSRELTSLFAETWTAANGPGGYRYRDLAADPVPPLDTAYCTLGRRVERAGLLPPARVPELVAGPAEERAWALTAPLIAELLAADTVVIGAPMYNLSVPGLLKAWIDRVTFPGAFLDPADGGSLLRDTKVVVVSARGGAYRPGTPGEPLDFHTPYLRAYVTRYGVAEGNLSFVTAELTVAGLMPHLAQHGDAAAGSLAAARAEVTALAAGRARAASDT